MIVAVVIIAIIIPLNPDITQQLVMAQESLC